MFVTMLASIDVIVGIRDLRACADARRIEKTGLETRNTRSAGLWYGRCYLVQRRNVMSPSSHLLNRVRSEFIEMPGLRLRLDQAQRLFTLERGVCETVLRSLVEVKFLGRFEDEVYARL